uniref:Uncharacterized protein n=1 Tax=Picea glauca TaxID=3330 RepID=A0A101M4K7_PICGL|nr:hypothetical protein ABT39_MTgene695 [Picea glauca]QHR86037.1 hypothetical protein Q903MT_gene35 [Picea sitchensis]
MFYGVDSSLKYVTDWYSKAWRMGSSDLFLPAPCLPVPGLPSDAFRSRRPAPLDEVMFFHLGLTAPPAS